MNFLVFFALLVHIIVTAAAPTEPNTTHPSPSTSPACRPYIKRQEWSAVSQTMRDSYIQAVLCLAKQPSRIGLNTTLYDDFAWVHMTLFDETHWPFASFLPWHRYFVHIYEKALQDCGYEGHALYWDWTKDAADPGNATIWTTGFGDETFISPWFRNPNMPNSFKNISGNTWITTCVNLPECISGPFASLVPAYYNGVNQTHSIGRNTNWVVSLSSLGHKFTQGAVDKVMEKQIFNDFQKAFYKGPHAAVHIGVGGEMPGPTSTNDPLFFVHHAQVDRIWWLWQQANRTDSYDGLKYVGPRGPPRGDFESEPAALSDMLSMLGMAPDIPVSKVMSTETALLCYTY